MTRATSTRRLAALSCIVTLAVGCSGSDDGGPHEPVGSVRQAILNGTPSDDGQNDVVMLLLVDPQKNVQVGLCTASLIAPRLVLTARHCLADTNSDVACRSDGTPVLGGEVRANHDPANLFVFTGKDRPDFIGGLVSSPLDMTKWKPAGQGLEIIDDKSGTLCNHDLGLLLLKDPVAGARIASLRLDGDVAVSEKLLTVGWGVASDEIEPKQRRQRGDVTVKRVGPDDNVPVLTKSEFLFDESICLGDSGGPIFSASTTSIVGVVSRGGNGSRGDTNPASTCVDADNVGTKLSPFRDLILDAFKRAGAQPQLEAKPSDGGGCSAARAGPRRSPAGWLAAAAASLLASAVRRRRRAPRAARAGR